MRQRLLARLDLATLRPLSPRAKSHSCPGSLVRVAGPQEAGLQAGSPTAGTRPSGEEREKQPTRT
eukprot:1972209-Pyramimonas_sp.AAC.1